MEENDKNYATNYHNIIQFLFDIRVHNEILFSDIAKQVGIFDNPWLIFSKYIDAVDEKCVQDMLPKWENKLGGARDVMSTLCFAMSQAEG